MLERRGSGGRTDSTPRMPSLASAIKIALLYAIVGLLFTDMVMPEGMTGLELVERLKAQEPILKAIVSSGYSPEITQGGVPTASDVVYLPKPYDVSKLAEVVRASLDQGEVQHPG